MSDLFFKLYVVVVTSTITSADHITLKLSVQKLLECVFPSFKYRRL